MFFLVVGLVSCKAKVDSKPTISKEVDKIACPENGTCSFEIIENKVLQIKTDELQGMYPEIINGNHVVLKFEYKKQGDASYQDNDYREEIFIELDKNKFLFETTDLKNEKLVFARWCYCKGQTGYYKIRHGKLSITKIDDKNFQLHLGFKVDEVPQIINEIKHTFSLQ